MDTVLTENKFQLSNIKYLHKRMFSNIIDYYLNLYVGNNL